MSRWALACAGVGGMLVGFAGLVGLARAQTPAMTPAAPSASQASDEDRFTVVVTAQKRPERPEDVPIALSVISGRRLDALQTNDAASLAKVTPGLVVTRPGAFTQPFLRGVGKRSNLGVENAVATYVDGVYLASPIGALLDLRGIERVEVLSGPQGTLFGRNTTGGVVQVITRDPTAATAGEVELHAGAWEGGAGFGRADAYVTGGGERLAANLAVSAARSGGYGRNLFTGRNDLGEIDHSLVARSKAIWRPGGAVTLTLAGDYQDIEQDYTSTPTEGFAAVGQPRVSGYREADQDGPSRSHFRYGGASVRAEAEIAGLALTSLTAGRRLAADYSADLDLGPRPLFEGIPRGEQTQLSQEFQLQSSAGGGATWTAGLFLIRIEERYAPITFLYGGDYAASLGGRLSQSIVDDGTVSSAAAYGQATWPLGAATRLTAGLRQTVERRTVRAHGERRFAAAPFVRPVPGLPLPGEPAMRAERRFSEPTWRLALDRRFTPALMGFVSAGRGFQSGGWTLQTPQAAPFEPERLDDVEAGVKYADPARRLTLDATVFHYDYSDMQVSAFTTAGAMTVNAASATVRGAELQASLRLGAGTEVGFGAAALRARFDRFANATCTNYSQTAAQPYATERCDVSGAQLPYAPDLTANLRATHRIGLGDGAAVILNALAAYNAGYVAEVDGGVRQAAYATFDAAAEWRPASGGIWVRLWATNLTDAAYADGLASFPTMGVRQRPGPPRRIGVSVGHGF